MSKNKNMLIVNGNPHIYELAVAINELTSYRNNLFKLELSKDSDARDINFNLVKDMEIDSILADICYAFIDRDLIVEEDILLSNITDTIISASSNHILEEDILEPLKMLFNNGLHQEIYPIYLEFAYDDEYLMYIASRIEQISLRAIDTMVESMLELENNDVINRETLKLITCGSIIPNGIGLFYENNQKFKILEER